jgi:hypothetical protein
LTEKGADAVDIATGERPPRITRSEPKPLTLFHRLEIVKVRLAIDDACRGRSLALPTWIMEQDCRPEHTPNEPLYRRLILHQRFAEGPRIVSCRPDASCLLRLPSQASERAFDELIVYLEMDRSTNSRQKEIEKLSGYQHLFKEQAFRRHWPESKRPTVRILYVCLSQERVRSLIAAFAGNPIAKYVRFAVFADIAPESVLTDAIWQTSDGELRAILR